MAVCVVDPVHVHVDGLSENLIVPALRGFRFLVADECADVQRLLVSWHLLPLSTGDVRAMTGEGNDDGRGSENGAAHSRRHRCAIGICRPLPNALDDTRNVGAAWL